MKLIDNLSDDARQLTKVILDDKSILTLDLIYTPAIQRWAVNVSRETLTVNGINLCVHPNALRQWRNIATFGLACISSDGGDPVFVNDFSTGRIQLYVLNQTEVESLEAQVFT